VHWIDRVKNVDRRVIYLLILFAVAIPLLRPIGLPVDISPKAQSIYDLVEALPNGATVMISFDYDPASRAEVHPMAEAIVEHCIRRKLKILAPALWPQGPSMASEVFGKMEKRHAGLSYGSDYAILGYFHGPTEGDPQVKALMGNLTEAYPQDTRGNQVRDLPIIKSYRGPEDLGIVISLSAGDPGVLAWVRQGVSNYQIKLAAGSTAVQTPQFTPYINAGQMVGLLGGLKGAAEYEKLVGVKGLGTSGMDAQSIAHLVIMLFILLANFVYVYENFVLKRKV